MKKLLEEIKDTLQTLMNNVDKTTSYRDGKSDGINISIREVEHKYKEVEALPVKDILEYIPQEFLDTIDRIELVKKFKFPDRQYPVDIYIQKKNSKPLKYAVICESERMDKSGDFDVEPMASSRDNEYIEDHSFDSIKEAWECFYVNHILKGDDSNGK